MKKKHKALTLKPSEKFLYNCGVRRLKQFGLKDEPMPLKERVDWSEVLELLKSQKLMLLFYREIVEDIPNALRGDFEVDYRWRECRQTAIMAEMRRIVPALVERQIHFSVSKGLILGHLLYGDICARDFSDVDILVEESNRRGLVHFLMEEGFRSVTGTDEVPNHTSYWELALKKELKDGQMWVEVKRIHSSFSDQHAEFFQNAVSSMEVEGTLFPVPHLLAQFILTIGSVYKNSNSIWKYTHIGDRVRLREYLDLAAFILRYRPQLNTGEMVRTLESLAYGHQAKVVMSELCSLFPSFTKNELVLAVTERNWERPRYSLYYPDLTWRSPILNRIFREEQARREFVDVLKEKWFDSGRKAAARFEPEGNLKLDGQLNVSGTSDIIRYSLVLKRESEVTLEVYIPWYLLTPGKQYLFFLPTIFEDTEQVYPPSEGIRILVARPSDEGVASESRCKDGVGLFRETVNAAQLFKDRAGTPRMCTSPVLVEHQPNSTTPWKALTEEHLWNMPLLLATLD